MLLDKELEFSSDQALTADAASESYIDLQAVGESYPPMWLYVVCTVDAGGTSPTITVELETDDNTSFTSATDLMTSEAVAAPDAGDVIWKIPVDLSNAERYLRLYYDLGGTTPTVTVSAYLATDVRMEL